MKYRLNKKAINEIKIIFESPIEKENGAVQLNPLCDLDGVFYFILASSAFIAEISI